MKSNTISLSELNSADIKEVEQTFLQCCSSLRWASQLAQCRPFKDLQELLAQSDQIWQACSEDDILEAFRGHPKIGDLSALKDKYANHTQAEQGQVVKANSDILLALKQGNDDYLEKFGFIFIVCATGKSAEEMLQLLQQRLPNEYEQELKIGADEQNKITHLRLQKALTNN